MSEAGGRMAAAPRLDLLRFLAVLLSGAAFVLSFPSPDLGGLAWVALVPLLLAGHGQPPRRAFWLGYAWGLVALGGVFWWMSAFGIAVWAMAAGLFAVFPAITMGAIAYVQETVSGPLCFLSIPVLWTAVEFLRSQGPLGVPWALLGESQHQALLVSQIASATGVYGVTFAVVLVNATLYTLLIRRTFLPVVVTGLVMGSTVAWGAAVLRLPSPQTMTAAVVQPDYGTQARWHTSDADRDLRTLGRLTQEAAAQDASLIVWPETASPTDILGDPSTLRAVQSWARDLGVSLIASSLEGGRANSAFSFTPTGDLSGRYVKMRLVPFAEFGEESGRRPGVLRTPHGAVGVAICFESIFPEIARAEVAEGAGMLAVITNDAWFDGSQAPAQHAAIAPFRAIEEGRYLLRAANSGFSQIIDPQGRVLASLGPDVRGILTARIAPLDGLTLYARLGDVFGWALVLAGAVLLLPGAQRIFALPSGRREFVHLLVVSLVPLAALLGAAQASRLVGVEGVPVGRAVVSVPLLAALAATAFLSRGHSARALGFQTQGFVPVSVIGLAIVSALTAIALLAFSAEGAAPALVPPRGGWLGGTAIQVVVVGLGLEWWLRGLVFSEAAAWRGWKLAVLWSALLGTLAAAPRGAEAMVWGLCSGLAFALLRARWAQVPALALAHGVGSALLGFLISPW
jgi:apolipoprotein N-acyltransferase